MNLYETYRSPEFIHDWDQVIWRLEFNDWEDAMRKLHPLNNPEERRVRTRARIRASYTLYALQR